MVDEINNLQVDHSYCSKLLRPAKKCLETHCKAPSVSRLVRIHVPPATKFLSFLFDPYIIIRLHPVHFGLCL